MHCKGLHPHLVLLLENLQYVQIYLACEAYLRDHVQSSMSKKRKSLTKGAEGSGLGMAYQITNISEKQIISVLFEMPDIGIS